MCSGVHHDSELGVMLPRAWLSPAYNFDDIGRSVMTMLRVNSNKIADIVTVQTARRYSVREYLNQLAKEF
jgi:hypothetical protein